MTDTGTLDIELAQLFTDVFESWQDGRDHVGLEQGLDRSLWSTLAELGLTRLTKAEGAGATWVEAAGLLRSAARYAAPVPLAEHDLLAGWLLEHAGLPEDDRIRTAAVLDADGHARRVPWASQVDAVVVLFRSDGRWHVADLDSSAVMTTPAFDMAGQPRDGLEVDLASVIGTPVGPETAEAFRLRGALARAAQGAGALERIVELCVRHATERRQFGRPLANFQAVQQLIATTAGESLLAGAAVDAAVAVAGDSTAEPSELELRTAVARSVVGHATSTVVRNAHQVHGAIGTTLEHALREYTQPALAWRTEFGTVRDWDLRLTELILGAGTTAWELCLPTGRQPTP